MSTNNDVGSYRAGRVALVAKLALAIVLLMLPGTTVRADWFVCNGDKWCNRLYGCFGSGWAYADCQVWCYENGGQTLVGYANCFVIPEG